MQDKTVLSVCTGERRYRLMLATLRGSSPGQTEAWMSRRSPAILEVSFQKGILILFPFPFVLFCFLLLILHKVTNHFILTLK